MTIGTMIITKESPEATKVTVFIDGKEVFWSKVNIMHEDNEPVLKINIIRKKKQGAKILEDNREEESV